MSLIAFVEIKNVYGVERIYPANETAKILTNMTGKKTLERDNIERIKKLGIAVEVITKKL
jgi:hypothetical protein